MSIETRTRQGENDSAHAGHQPDARQDAPAQVAYDERIPDEPVGDALPLDGGLTLNYTEPQHQTDSQALGLHTLAGSEASETVNASVEGDSGADAAFDMNDPISTAPAANTDPSIG